MTKAAEGYALGPTRVQHQNRDPRGWREFADQFAEHSTEGAALTMRGVQKRRPSLFELVDKMKTITAPTLIMTGDEDWPCLEPGMLMKKNIATAALVVMAKRRPQHQSGGAGVVQRAPVGAVSGRRRRHMADARPARHGGRDLGALRSATSRCSRHRPGDRRRS